VTGALSRSDARRDAARSDSGGFGRLAGRTLMISGVLAAAGVAFIVAMFASFAVGARDAALAFGRVNDVLILVGYLLAAPAVLALRAILRPEAGRAGDVVALVGLVAIGAIVVLQLLLVAGRLTFAEQVGPVSLALLVLGAWFVVVGLSGSRSGLMPRGARMGLLAALYVGYPIWAIWLGRRLATEADAGVQNRADAV
jgi:hypothetical protein